MKGSISDLKRLIFDDKASCETITKLHISNIVVDKNDIVEPRFEEAIKESKYNLLIIRII